MTIKTIKIPIYQGTLTVIFDNDLSYVQKKYNTIPLNNYGAVFLSNDKEFRKYVVAFETEDLGTIAHEVTHIKNQIFKDCMMELDVDNDEAEAYLVGWLYREIHKVLLRNTNILK